jgi:hypothetical protein
VIAKLVLPFKIGMVVVASATLVATHSFGGAGTNANADSFPTRSDVSIAIGSGHSLNGGSGRAANLAPGDTYENSFNITIAPAKPQLHPHVTLLITAPVNASSALVANKSNGLRVALDVCSHGWRTHKGALVCPGKTTTLLANTPVARVKGHALVVHAIAPGVTSHVRVRFQLPISAGNSFEHLSSSLRLTFATTA